MRSKIIVVNAAIVLLVALLSYVLLATSLKSIISDPAERKHEVERSLRAASAQLALDALRLERWLEKSGGRTLLGLTGIPATRFRALPYARWARVGRGRWSWKRSGKRRRA